MAQIEVLQTLRDAGAVRLGDLATRLNLAQSTVSTLVGRLLADGLVARGVEERDRRAAVLELTTEGERVVSEWDDAHQRRISAALEHLRPADRRRIASALPALGQLVSALEGELR
jgi:DNA-binding MarR family transcriptional regulator